MTDQPYTPRPTPGMMIIGTVIFVATLAAWLYAETHDVDTSALLAFAVPVVGALFLSSGISAARSAAEQSANQTNGSMDAKIRAAMGSALSEHDGALEAAVSAALAKRDAARTRQALGDIGIGDHLDQPQEN